MRIHAVAIIFLIGCNPSNIDAPDGDAAAVSSTDQPESASVRDRHHGNDRLKDIFDEVDGARVTQTPRQLARVAPVVVHAATITLGHRFHDAGRQNFRAYWTQTMQNLGLEV